MGSISYVQSPPGELLGLEAMAARSLPSSAATLAELISYVYDAFHVPLRQDLRLLEHLTESAAFSQHPAAKAMHALASRFADDARLHMSREENEIFPRILSGQGPRCANIVAALHVDNHQSHERGRGLRRLAALCAEAVGAPSAYSEATPLDPHLMSELHRLLDKLEFQLAEHHRIEEDLLFPRALSGEPPYGDDD
jgi:iron-sulfur cluster repair protein YtfE (RIC family)